MLCISSIECLILSITILFFFIMPLSKEESLIVKYITKSSNSEELINLITCLDDPKNRIKFKDYVRVHYLINYNMNEVDTEKIKEQLLRRIRKDKSLLNRIKPFMKYAAIVLMVSTLGYIFQKELINTSKAEILVVGSEDITLKLEDGSVKVIKENGFSQVIDSSGKVIGTQKGKQLVYSDKVQIKQLVYNELKVPHGKRFELKLSDGTNVFLNSGSTIKYPIRFIKGQPRQVFLKGGEAFFDIAKDEKHPFKIDAQEIGIQVLGTKFNVATYPEDASAEVVLVEGSLSMHLEQLRTIEDQLILKPGFKGIFNKEFKVFSTKKVNTSIYTSWIDGNIVFRKSSFENIIQKLERHYNVKIVNNNDALSKQTFNATIEIDKETIEDVLSYFNKVYQIEYSIVNNKIIIN